jgi:hypothetical protein
MGEDDRASILARRAPFIATALAGLVATTSGAEGCADDDPTDGAGGQAGAPQPCLDMPPPRGGGDGGAGGVGGTPAPCLEVGLGGGGMGGA